MTEGAKLVTSDPDIPEREVADETLDTKRPVAVSGDTHEHLEDQQGGEEKRGKSEEEFGKAIGIVLRESEESIPGRMKTTCWNTRQRTNGES